MADPLLDFATFLRIAETGSLTRAASELHQSLTAVSRRLARLEERLGVRLVNRTTRRLSLTDEGAIFHERASRILDDILDAESEVSQAQDAAVGSIRLTTSFGFGRRHLARLVHAFEREHPRVRIHLDVSDRVVDLVDAGFDLAVRLGGLADSSLIARSLVANDYVLCAAPSYLERRGRLASVSDLTSHDVIVYGTPARNVWTFAGGEKVEVGGDLSTNDGDLAHAWALEGAGIVHKTIWEVADDIRQGKLEIVLPDRRLPGAPIHAVLPHSRLTPARVRLLLDFLSKRLRETWQREIAPILPAHARPPTNGGRRSG
ncbi:LysR family transcriptional regulator [Brevundimonas sp.]|uniref:LysR family transcriptional regulator n=1 Tax=Brevundimonas sp. TaxID=1871086 RepID=UPI0037BFEA81